MSSAEFTALTVRLSEVRRHLLPSSFSPIGSYSRAQQERARAYVLLVHAEVEQYMEDIARAYALRRSVEWSTAVGTTGGKVAIVRRGHKGEISRSQEIQAVLNGGHGYLSAQIGKFNHGIKERNLETMFLPLGMNVRASFPDLFRMLTQLGGRRGGFAHAGGFVATINPEDEYKSTKLLVAEIRAFDKILSR